MVFPHTFKGSAQSNIYSAYVWIEVVPPIHLANKEAGGFAVVEI
jgi:hypothetical protein